MKTIYRNRQDAGEQLGASLQQIVPQEERIVLALPRGGVPVAWEVSRSLGCPLDVLVVRKLAVPGHEEFVMGAIASHGIATLTEDLLSRLDLSLSEIDRVIQIEGDELRRREEAYGASENRIDPSGKTVIVVDDGIATGSTMIAAILLLQKQRAGSIIAATPVASTKALELLRWHANQVVVPVVSDDFSSVGEWYEDFSHMQDEEVRRILELSRRGILTE